MSLRLHRARQEWRKEYGGYRYSRRERRQFARQSLMVVLCIFSFLALVGAIMWAVI